MILELLKRAKALIDEPKYWCVGVPARDFWRDKCDPTSHQVMSRTATQAIIAVCCDDMDKASRVIAFISRFIEENSTLDQYNDACFRTHEQMMELFDRAIAGAEKEFANAA